MGGEKKEEKTKPAEIKGKSIEEKISGSKEGFKYWAITITAIFALFAGAGIWAYNEYVILPEFDKRIEQFLLYRPTFTRPTQTSPAKPTTKDETADWKTYTNEKYDFSMKYPKNFYLSEGLYNKVEKKKVQKDEWIFIDKKKIVDNAYLEGGDWPEPYFEIRIDEKEIILNQGTISSDKKKDIIFAGQKAVKITSTKPSGFDGSYSSEIRFNYKKHGYTISWENSDNKGTHDTEIDQMLLIFQFTS